jgi:hypothetical protein
MRRVLEYFQWKSHWWSKLWNVRADLVAPPDPQIRHRLRAYADRQTSMYASLVDSYVNHWRKFLVEHSLGLEWLKFYPPTPPTVEPVLFGGLDEPLEEDEDESELDSKNPKDQDFEERFANLHVN